MPFNLSSCVFYFCPLLIFLYIIIYQCTLRLSIFLLIYKNSFFFLTFCETIITCGIVAYICGVSRGTRKIWSIVPHFVQLYVYIRRATPQHIQGSQKHRRTTDFNSRFLKKKFTRQSFVCVQKSYNSIGSRRVVVVCVCDVYNVHPYKLSQGAQCKTRAEHILSSALSLSLAWCNCRLHSHARPGFCSALALCIVLLYTLYWLNHHVSSTRWLF